MAKRKPTDPQEIARQRMSAESRREAKAEANRLTATGCEATLQAIRDQGGTKWEVHGQRKDVFELLRARKALSEASFTAIRGYEEDKAKASGKTTPARSESGVRASIEGAPGQSVSQAIVDAGKRVAFVESRLAPRDLRLLTALLIEGAAYQQTWRATVQSVTLETNEAAQSARVRAMADNVADIRQIRREAA